MNRNPASPPRAKGFTRHWAFASFLLLTGCADITVKKASPDSEGIPFYLQRPYVVIQQEFPVEGEEGYALATLENGMLKVSIPPSLEKRFDQKQLSVPLGGVLFRREEPGRATSGSEPETDPKPDEEPDTQRKETREEFDVRAEGVAKWDPAVPNEQNINSFFKIVYLPDLDEKYVINPNAGMGTAALSVAHGPGNIVNQFQVKIDNSEIGRFIMDTANTAVGLAKKLVETKTGIGIVTSSEVEEAVKKTGKRSILLRFIYVGHATPGIYPILKGEEYKDLSPYSSSTKTGSANENFRRGRKVSTLPINRAMLLADETQAASSGDSARSTANDPFLIPAVYPYTRWAMKVRRSLALEAVDLTLPPADATPRENARVEPPQEALIESYKQLNSTLETVMKNKSFEASPLGADGLKVTLHFRRISHPDSPTEKAVLLMGTSIKEYVKEVEEKLTDEQKAAYSKFITDTLKKHIVEANVPVTAEQLIFLSPEKLIVSVAPPEE